jgi:hypothetical protein
MDFMTSGWQNTLRFNDWWLRCLVPVVVIFALLGCSSCVGRDLRGTYKRSADGKTYLAVIDDNGAKCVPLVVDGRVWPHATGEAGRIEPGSHTISCGTDVGLGIGFEIPPGVVFKFDYWGP